MAKRAPFIAALATAARLRCPCCRQGRMFRGWPNRVWRNCPVCALPLIRESGYYIGGMIVTYVLTTLSLLAAFLVSLLFPYRSGVSDNYLLWTGFAVLLVLLFVRPSYSLWLAADYWIAPWTAGEGSETKRGLHPSEPDAAHAVPVPGQPANPTTERNVRQIEQND